jgi:hypothetical protein
MRKTIITAMMLLMGVVAQLQAATQGNENTRGVKYAQMYDERPRAIVVMPPINRTNHVEAKDFFYTTMYVPLCDKGYYVFPPMLTMEMFQAESAYDAEMFIEGNLDPFRNVLGADAAMFTIIKDLKRLNALGTITVNVEFILRSTKTGSTLYQREGTITVDNSVKSSQGGLFGALLDMAATTISTAATDKVEVGRKCASYVLSNMPEGPYSPNYEKDQNVKAGKDVIKETL